MSSEVDEAALDVRAEELHPHAIADIESPEPLLEPSFHRRLENPHPRSLGRSAGHDRFKNLTNAIRKEERLG